MATMYFYCCSNLVLNIWYQKKLCMLPSTSISASQSITKSNWNLRTAWRRSLRNSITFKNSRITNSHKKKKKQRVAPKPGRVANSQASVAKTSAEPTCDFITPASLLSRFPHFNTWETPICVSDASAAIGFCWHAVLFSEKKQRYMYFFLLNSLWVSTIWVDVCQRRLLLQKNKTDVGGWEAKAGWLAGWQVGKITSGTEMDGYISCSNNSQLFGGETLARAGRLAQSLQ